MTMGKGKVGTGPNSIRHNFQVTSIGRFSGSAFTSSIQLYASTFDITLYLGVWAHRPRPGPDLEPVSKVIVSWRPLVLPGLLSPPPVPSSTTPFQQNFSEKSC